MSLGTGSAITGYAPRSHLEDIRFDLVTSITNGSVAAVP